MQESVRRHQETFRAARFVPLLAVAGMIIFCQCVFFNMFYNAKVSYDTAYQAHHKLLKKNPDSTIATLPSEIASNYDRAIEKATKVMEEYPRKKKWHDDALFLIGKANYFKGEYEKALRSLARLREDFPASPFVPESYLFSGRCYLKMENFDKADETFDLVLEKYPDLNAEQEVTLLKVEIALSREGKGMAIDLLEKTRAQIKSKEKKMELSLKTARLYMDLKLYDKAITLLHDCPRDKKFPEQLYTIDILLAGCFEAKDSLERAMSMVNMMLDNRIYTWHFPDILLKKASIYEKMGKIDDAIATYKSITEEYAAGSGKTAPSGTPVSSVAQDALEMAWFRLGLMYQLKKGDFAKAKECFNKISASAKDTIIKNSAARRIRSIDTLMASISMKDTMDTIKNTSRRDAIEFKIGELFWLELDLPDSAFMHFKKLAMKTDSLRPKALYSAAYIARTALKDTAQSDSLFSILLKNYPVNNFTKRAQKDRGEKITVYTRRDSAQDAYLRAESLFFNSGEAEQAVDAFKNVYTTYSDCEQGIQALYAAGWISNEVLRNNKTAYKLYRMLCDSFPKSDICTNDVKPRLKIVSDTLAARIARRGKTSSPPPPAAVTKPVNSKTAGTPVPPAAKNTRGTTEKDTVTAERSASAAQPTTQKIEHDIKPASTPAAALPKAPSGKEPEKAPPPQIDSEEVIGQTPGNK